MESECVICLKHQGRGPLTGQLIGRIGDFYVYHAKTDDQGLSPLGWLFIESVRHVPYVADLTDEEASALGRLRTHLARALRIELGAEFVLTFVLGIGVAHFHEHLVPRMPGTSADVAWYASDEALPKGDAAQVKSLAEGLRNRLGLSIS
jgi:ATP adenylyltransferase